jgi:hypothetical protein
MWSSETCMILWRKTPKTFGRGMTLRYSRCEGFRWMRLAFHTGQFYRLVTVFYLITVSKKKPVSKKKLAKLHITWITCGPPKHAWFYEGKLLELLGGRMTLRYSRGEGFWWMRLASRTGRSYRLVTMFSLITISEQKLVSKQKPSKTIYHMDYMWSSEIYMILWRKTPRTFGRGWPSGIVGVRGSGGWD